MNIQQSFKDAENKKCLYLVPTPIGNLEDMTYRAVRILNEVDIVLAEDTRMTAKLFNHYQIMTPLKSFHDHSSSQRVDEIIQMILSGKQIALVSDAGMPLINDPGHPLVQEALKNNILVIALPGANAALTALIASGLPATTFTYYGFYPRSKNDRQTLLQFIKAQKETAIFYESPYRITQMLQSFKSDYSPNAQVVIARELTKRFEEYLRGTVDEVLVYVKEKGVKGECVVLLEGLNDDSKKDNDPLLALSIPDHVKQLMQQEQLKPNAAIKQVAKMRRLPRSQVYNSYHNLD